ncbi:MAG: orotate phosphoribosyltransferase [Chloroflexi bacterium]|nr:orotate phosphoribosyltransferase [Chloroflexota bacterium]
METLDTRIARILLEINAVGFAPDRPITFKSGIVSPVYVDNRGLPYHPAQWRIVIEGFQSLIHQEQMRFDVVAGVAVGGVPHSAALAYTLERPSVFIRKEAKGHGKQKRVEGGDVQGRRVLLIEDLVTTGGSSLDGVAALREEGALVEFTLAIVSYGFPESLAAFESAGVQLHTLTNFRAIMEQAQQLGKLDASQVATVSEWLKDPYNWKQP